MHWRVKDSRFRNDHHPRLSAQEIMMVPRLTTSPVAGGWRRRARVPNLLELQNYRRGWPPAGAGRDGPRRVVRSHGHAVAVTATQDPSVTARGTRTLTPHLGWQGKSISDPDSDFGHGVCCSSQSESR
jgi:hypothetical protein